MEAGKRLEDLLFLTTELTDLLTKENEALRRYDLQTVQNLVERKTMISRAYEIRVFGLKQEGLDVGDDSALQDDLERLRIIGAEVDELISENEKLLKVNLEASRQFMEAVSAAVKESTPSTGAYSANGKTGENSPLSTRQAASLTLNETL